MSTAPWPCHYPKGEKDAFIFQITGDLKYGFPDDGSEVLTLFLIFWLILCGLFWKELGRGGILGVEKVLGMGFR